MDPGQRMEAATITMVLIFMVQVCLGVCSLFFFCFLGTTEIKVHQGVTPW